MLFFCFEEKEYQTESKRNETFRRVIFGTEAIQKTWSVRKGSNEEDTRQGGAPTPLGAPSILVGPSLLHRPTSSSYLCSHTSNTSGSTTKPYFHRRNLLYPRDPSWGLFRSSAGGGIDHRGSLNQLHGLSGDV